MGAGAMMRESRVGAKSVCSEWTVGAGGTTAAFREGAERELSADTLGAGGTMLVELSVRPARD